MSKNLKTCPKCGEIMHIAYRRCVTCNYSFLRANKSKRLPNKKSVETQNLNDEENFFSVKGRIRRRTYLIRFFLLLIPILMLHILFVTTGEEEILFLYIIVSIIIGVLQMIQGVKRLHDVNQSGEFILLFFIPIINFILALYLLMKDGSVGDNDYGEDPKKKERKTTFINKDRKSSRNESNKIEELKYEQNSDIKSLEYLEKLASLKNKGIITEEEYNVKKKQILGI